MVIDRELDKILKKVEKPARYIGGEVNSVTKNPDEVAVRIGFAFPDTYEIGMSYLGLQILYNILNRNDEIFCERVFAPAPDMEEIMMSQGRELFTLETFTPVREMDILGFTLQYELCFTNVLNMLELGGIPLKSCDRDDRFPVIIAGGPCAYNPEPLADFIDAFLIGDGEELLEAVCMAKKSASSKQEFLETVCKMDGVYVPAFYEPRYNDDGTLKEIRKLYEGAPDRVRRAVISDIESAEFPVNNIVPFIDTVHDRSVVETFRGCTRGCRFCQAGMIYRPVRERSKETIEKLAVKQLENTGHDELSLLSLSTSDYSRFEELATELMDMCRERNVALSLPSLRLDTFSFKVLQEIQKYRKSGLTFAPEAGSQRLRDIINKNITEEDLIQACTYAFQGGWNNVKLYFMMGLPTETNEDFDEMSKLCRNIAYCWRMNTPNRARGVKITASTSCFVPKPQTPFQWDAQATKEELDEKTAYLRTVMKTKNVTFRWHASDTSYLEGVFARGDRRTAEVLYMAWKSGCKMDGWEDCFSLDKWMEAFHACGLDPAFYANRQRPLDEVFPWDHIGCGTSKEHLKREWERSRRAEPTPSCLEQCAGCGAASLMKGCACHV